MVPQLSSELCLTGVKWHRLDQVSRQLNQAENCIRVNSGKAQKTEQRPFPRNASECSARLADMTVNTLLRIRP